MKKKQADVDIQYAVSDKRARDRRVAKIIIITIAAFRERVRPMSTIYNQICLGHNCTDHLRSIGKKRLRVWYY